MSGFSVTTASTLQCPHGGAVRISTLNTNVKADGASAALATDQYTISGCPFQIPVGVGTVPSPCLTVRWVLTDMRVKVNGNATLSAGSVGMCQNAQQVPQGSVIIANTQRHVESQ
jgi:uncharacterized Zn-binding protein involved in type VI secretion